MTKQPYAPKGIERFYNKYKNWKSMRPRALKKIKTLEALLPEQQGEMTTSDPVVKQIRESYVAQDDNQEWRYLK